MKLEKAITLSLGHLFQPVVTNYDLGLILINLFISRRYDNEPVKIKRRNFQNKKFFLEQIERLLDSGVLTPHRSFSVNEVYRIVGKMEFDAGDVSSSVDPFSYVSHLSAMAFHGITDRRPSVLIISTPEQKSWSHFASEKMSGDLKEHYLLHTENKLPKLKRIGFQKIDAMPVKRISSLHHGAYRNLSRRSMRVSTIGRTFLDMLKNPAECGGMRHVIDVFSEFGGKYARLIIDEVETHGNKIEKVRAGYLLDEAAKVKDDRTDRWLEYVQRGGSRKLDPNEEYSSTFSEKWCLSINV